MGESQVAAIGPWWEWRLKTFPESMWSWEKLIELILEPECITQHQEQILQKYFAPVATINIMMKNKNTESKNCQSCVCACVCVCNQLMQSPLAQIKFNLESRSTTNPKERTFSLPLSTFPTFSWISPPRVISLLHNLPDFWQTPSFIELFQWVSHPSSCFIPTVILDLSSGPMLT